jgi:uncharacterized protein YjeT (DUF2065 family)
MGIPVYPACRRHRLPVLGRILLYCAAALIALGGLYDIFVPRLPSNLATMCAGDEQACKLVREMLRALGGSLVAVGVAVALLVSQCEPQNRTQTLVLILVLVLPSEGVNVFSMYRVGSPFLIPLAFLLLTSLGVLGAWPGLF